MRYATARRGNLVDYNRQTVQLVVNGSRLLRRHCTECMLHTGITQFLFCIVIWIYEIGKIAQR